MCWYFHGSFNVKTIHFLQQFHLRLDIISLLKELLSYILQSFCNVSSNFTNRFNARNLACTNSWLIKLFWPCRKVKCFRVLENFNISLKIQFLISSFDVFIPTKVYINSIKDFWQEVIKKTTYLWKKRVLDKNHIKLCWW